MNGVNDMASKFVRGLGAIIVTLGVLGISAPAQAQWGSQIIGVAEYDTESALLLLAGVSAGPRGLGWKPRIGVQGYHLSYDAGSSRTNVMVVRPYVGMRNAFEGGSVSANIGYAFSDKDAAFTSGAFVPDRGDGVVLSGGLDHWGTGGPLGYQVLGAYNFGTESIWTRGRVTTRMGAAGASGRQRRLGGELAFLSGEGYRGWQPGGVLELHNGNGRVIGLGAGMKFFQGGGDAVYFKAEISMPLSR
jgi:hypothetical protein